MVTETLDRRNSSPPFLGQCPWSGYWLTIGEWRPHPLRQRFALWTCAYCSETAGHLQEHAIEFVELEAPR